MRQTLCGLLLALVVLIPGHSFAASSRTRISTPQWTACTLHLDFATMTRITGRECHHYAILHPSGSVSGHWTATVWVSPHVRLWIKFPRFAVQADTQEPVGASRWEWVTGYSYGCGDVNGVTADGSVPQPYFTVASNDPSLWHHHIYVPSLGFHGYVQDTGAPFDLFMPSCGAAYTVTGQREVIVY